MVATPLASGDSAVPWWSDSLTFKQTTLAQVSLLKSHGLIGLGPTLVASFNLNYLPEISPPNPTVRLSSHPLNTSQKGD